MSSEDEFDALWERAVRGEQGGWDQLLERLNPLVRAIVARYSLDAESTADVVQTVWIRLFENADRIRDPNRLPGWLATTSRNESVNRITELRRAARSSEMEGRADESTPQPVDRLIEDELRGDLKQAFGALSFEDRTLLGLLVAVPRLSYAEIAELVGRPIGSLGPSRARSLARLRAGLLRIRGDLAA